LLEIAGRKDDVLLQGGIEDTGGQRCDSRSPQEECPLCRPGLGLPAVDEQDEAKDDAQGNDGEESRLGKGSNARSYKKADPNRTEIIKGAVTEKLHE